MKDKETSEITPDYWNAARRIVQKRREMLSDEGAERLIDAHNKLSNDLISLDSDEELNTFLRDTDNEKNT